MKTHQKNLTYLIIAAISALIFCLIYGVNILNPTYVDWLIGGGLNSALFGMGGISKKCLAFSNRDDKSAFLS